MDIKNNNMKFSPLISVVMPVHNCGHYIKDSIDSVLSQTMPDFELIIVNDGSTDNSSEIAHSYPDKRIKVIDLHENRGCYPSRNIGMKIAKGKYICPMDADDLILPDRLEKQYRFLEENKEFGMVYGLYQFSTSNRPVFKETDYEMIKILFLQHCYLCHATGMIRTALVEKYGLYYNETYTYASDYDWQVMALSLFPVAQVNELVYLYRIHAQQISTSKRREQDYFADQIRMNQLSFFGIEPSESEKKLHLNFIGGIIDDCFNEKKIDQWIDRLMEANRRTQYYYQRKLENFLQAHRYKYQYIHQNK